MPIIQIQVNDFVRQLDIPLQSPCTPPQVLNPLTGKCEAPSGYCTPPQVFNPITRLCESITCTLPQIFNPATQKCEIPSAECTPPRVYNPITQKCEYPTGTGELAITAKKIVISTLRNAFRTQEIPITVIATCTNPPSPIKGEDASLIIDGNPVDRKTVIDGTASFTYTFKEAGLHTIRVTIPRSSSCDTEGSASIQIDVSSEVPSTLERLRVEREAQQKIADEIERVREETRKSIGGI